MRFLRRAPRPKISCQVENSPIRRTESVSTASARRETLLVMRAGLVITFLAWIFIGLRVPDATFMSAGADAGSAAELAARAARDLLPFQILFRELEPGTQRTFRQLQEGAIEAENRRATVKSWPAVAALAADGIPPFAKDPIDRAHYRWTMTRDGPVVNYRGEPDAAAAGSDSVVSNKAAGRVRRE